MLWASAPSLASFAWRNCARSFSLSVNSSVPSDRRLNSPSNSVMSSSRDAMTSRTKGSLEYNLALESQGAQCILLASKGDPYQSELGWTGNSLHILQTGLKSVSPTFS